MAEEIVPTEESQKEEPQETKEEVPQPVEEKKEKRWLKPLLFSILGIIVAGGLVFAGYKLGKREASLSPVKGPTPTITPQATPTPGVYHTPGMDFTIDKALRVEKKTDKDLLVLSVTFTANVECPLPGGAVCGYDIRGFRLVDENGFVQDMLFSFPTVKYLMTNPISQRTLEPGEKDKGDIFFDIPKEKNKFFLTYSSAGETTEKILIEPELFDPTANWKTYTNTKYGYLIKYSNEWILSAPEVCIPSCPEAADNMSSIKPTDTQYPLGYFIVTSWNKGTALPGEEELNQEYYKNQARSWNWQSSQEEEIQVGGYEAWSMTGRIEVADRVCFERYITVKTPHGLWEISLYDTQERFYKDIFNLMLSTFKFLE